MLNAERKLDDASFLLDKKSFGSAQSLCVIALEEMAKAIILEFADLNYVGGDVVKDSMRHHPSKQTIIEAFEKGILFVGSLDFRDKESKNDMDDKFIDMGKLARALSSSC